MRPLLPAALVGALAAAAAGGDARADGTAEHGPEGERHNRVNVRVGGSTADETGRPTLCLEVTTWSRLSVEGCGTGSGFLHSDPGAELAHFRAKWLVYQRAARHGVLRAQAGAGFAELQLDADEPGFRFGEPDEPGIEVAGPEASATVQWLSPLSPSVELITSVTAGAAYLPHAGELVVPQDTVQPFLSFELGVGW